MIKLYVNQWNTYTSVTVIKKNLTATKLHLFLQLSNISDVKVLGHLLECFLAISQLEYL